MNLSKKATTAVITLATIAMLGLCWVQYNWLSQSIETNRKTFYQTIDLATQIVREEYIRDNDLVRATVGDLRSMNRLSMRTHHGITSVIDSVLLTYDISTRYTYGIYEHLGGERQGFQFLGGTSVDSTFLLFECSTDRRPHGWVTLTCQDMDTYNLGLHLGIFFPNINDYLLSSVQGSLLTSVVFILLLIGCFAYTIITIRKQKKLSEMKNDFINNLTHEFKTPIFSIDLASGLLKKVDEIKNSERLSKYVDVIDSEGKRLRGQVDKVLQMALVDSGNFKLEKKEFDFHDLLKNVSRNFDFLIKERKGNLTLNLNARDANLYADETHLKNIVYNLLDNAQKYTEGKPDIIVTTADSKDGLVVSIKDNGIGISKEVQRFIFDKFYRAESGNVHNIKGFGLGLSYVKSVVEAHKGKIKLYSRPDSGSVFTLQFPMA